VRELLEFQRPSSAANDLRGFEWHYFRRLCAQEVQSLPAFAMLVTSVAWSADGRLLAAAGAEGKVKVWNAATVEPVTELGEALFAGPSSVVFREDGQLLAVGDTQGRVRVWRTATWASFALLQLPHKEEVSCVRFTTSGRYLAAASAGGTIQLWDLTTARPHVTLAGHTGRVEQVSCSPDDRRLASAGADGTIRVWDTTTGLELRTLRSPTRGAVQAVAFSPDGLLLVAATDGGTALRVWSAATYREVRLLHQYGSVLQDLAFSHDGRYLALGSTNGTARLWDLRAGAEDRQLRGHTGPIRGVAFSADGDRLATGSDDGTVKIWDLTEFGEAVQVLPCQAAGLTTLAVCPAGRLLAATDTAGNVFLCDLPGRKVLHRWPAHAGRGRCVAYAPTGQFVASVGAERSIQVRATATGALVQTLRTPEVAIWCVAFSGDGRLLAGAGDDQTLQLWDLASGAVVQSLRAGTGTVRAVAFSPDGRYLAAGGDDRTVRLWTTADLRLVQAWPGHAYEIEWLTFSPDSQRLVSCSQDRTLKVWDLARQKEVRTLKGHTEEVKRAAFSPDQRRLASISEANVVKVWDTTTLEEICTLAGSFSNAAQALAFTSDSRQLILATWEDVTFLDGSDERPDEQAVLRAAGRRHLLAWRQRQIAEGEAKQLWFSPLYHLSRQLQEEPTNAAAFRRRADAYRRQAKWLPAAADYTRALELDPALPIKEERARCLASAQPVRAALLVGLAAEGALTALAGLASP